MSTIRCFHIPPSRPAASSDAAREIKAPNDTERSGQTIWDYFRNNGSSAPVEHISRTDPDFFDKMNRLFRGEDGNFRWDTEKNVGGEEPKVVREVRLRLRAVSEHLAAQGGGGGVKLPEGPTAPT